MLHKRTQKDLALSSLTGILVGTSYIPFPAWAIFFCFVPLWIAWLRADSIKQVFFTGWIAQFVLTLIGFNWIAHTVSTFGHLPMWAAIIGLFLFCSFASLNIPIAGVIWFKLLRNAPNWAKVLGLITLTAITERLYPMIFDWHLGYTWLWMRWPAAQTADVIGFFGLSSLTIAINGLILWACYFKTRRVAVITAALGAIAVLNIWGLQRKAAQPPPDRSARVLVVQGNIGDESPLFRQFGQAARDMIFQRYTGLTDKGLAETKQPVDFALWPETAFPDVLAAPDMSAPFAQKLRMYLAERKLALVTGAYGYAQGKMSNSLFALNEQGLWSSLPYAKTHLLAFGEYIPGSAWFPQIKEWIPEAADWGRGNGPQIFDLKTYRLGAQICYEGLFDFFSRGLANKGAQMIVNATHDNWYGTWQEPYQHLYMTLARAIETRLPLIRATNTGFSTAILANGDVLASSAMDEEWWHIFEIPYLENPVPPPFLSWGFYIFPVILGASLVGLLIGRFKNWRWN